MRLVFDFLTWRPGIECRDILCKVVEVHRDKLFCKHFGFHLSITILPAVHTDSSITLVLYVGPIWCCRESRLRKMADGSLSHSKSRDVPSWLRQIIVNVVMHFCKNSDGLTMYCDTRWYILRGIIVLNNTGVWLQWKFKL